MAAGILFYFTICWLTWGGLILFIQHNIVLDLKDLRPTTLLIFALGVLWPIGIPISLIALSLSYSTKKD